MSNNIITFRNSKPAAAYLLDVAHEEEPYEPDYYCTPDNIIRYTEEMLTCPLYITVAEDHLRQIDDPDLTAKVNEALDALNAFRIDLLAGYDGRVEYYRDIDYGNKGYTWVLYIDYLNKKADLRLYRSAAAAKGQVTKFLNRLARVSPNKHAGVSVNRTRNRV